MHTPSASPVASTRHVSHFGWASWWGVLGIHVTIGNAIWRLGARGVEAVVGGLTPLQWLILAAWVAFMLYTEGYRGFHLRFSPMVIARARTLAGDAPLWHKVLAPAYVMGLFHATRRRLLLSWGLLVMIATMVMLVRLLEQPWRGIVDAGVVLGLLAGLISVSAWALSTGALVSPELPEEA